MSSGKELPRYHTTSDFLPVSSYPYLVLSKCWVGLARSELLQILLTYWALLTFMIKVFFLHGGNRLQSTDLRFFFLQSNLPACWCSFMRRASWTLWVFPLKPWRLQTKVPKCPISISLISDVSLSKALIMLPFSSSPKSWSPLVFPFRLKAAV